MIFPVIERVFSIGLFNLFFNWMAFPLVYSMKWIKLIYILKLQNKLSIINTKEIKYNYKMKDYHYRKIIIT